MVVFAVLSVEERLLASPSHIQPASWAKFQNTASYLKLVISYVSQHLLKKLAVANNDLVSPVKPSL